MPIEEATLFSLTLTLTLCRRMGLTTGRFFSLFKIVLGIARCFHLHHHLLPRWVPNPKSSLYLLPWCRTTQGLGKTVEIIACMLLNAYRIPPQAESFMARVWQSQELGPMVDNPIQECSCSGGILPSPLHSLSATHCISRVFCAGVEAPCDPMQTKGTQSYMLEPETYLNPFCGWMCVWNLANAFCTGDSFTQTLATHWRQGFASGLAYPTGEGGWVAGYLGNSGSTHHPKPCGGKSFCGGFCLSASSKQSSAIFRQSLAIYMLCSAVSRPRSGRESPCDQSLPVCATASSGSHASITCVCACCHRLSTVLALHAPYA